MNYSLLSIVLTLSVLFLSGCDRELLVPWEAGSDKPAYAQGSGGSKGAESRAPLDVPPELRDDVEVPNPDGVATANGAGYSSEEKSQVAGQAVSLDGRVYQQDAATVFSAVVDAMTALNLPVQSVDSPSGTLTTDWIKKSTDATAAMFGGMFGGETVLAIRYRYVVRVLRQKAEAGEMTRLEIRTTGQAFVNRQWVDRPIKRKVADELFAATEERLKSL